MPKTIYFPLKNGNKFSFSIINYDMNYSYAFYQTLDIPFVYKGTAIPIYNDVVSNSATRKCYQPDPHFQGGYSFLYFAVEEGVMLESGYSLLFGGWRRGDNVDWHPSVCIGDSNYNPIWKRYLQPNTDDYYYIPIFLWDNAGAYSRGNKGEGYVNFGFSLNNNNLENILSYTIYDFLRTLVQLPKNTGIWEKQTVNTDVRYSGYSIYSSMWGTNPFINTTIVNQSNEILVNPTDDIYVFLSKVLFNSDAPKDTTVLSYNATTPAPPDPDNPLDPGGTSSTGGGKGSFDDTSDPVDFAPLPSLTAINSGFVGLYAPTLSQLQGLSNYLWNESFNLDQLKKLFADPMDLLISLTIVPLSPPITVQENIKVGFISTGLPMNKVEQQFITYDFGSLEIKPYFDSALDYSPFTKISIYLPYIGLRQLNVDEIMGTTIHLQYNIDLFTGSCVAEIKVADSVLYTFNGNLASSIPLTAGNYSNFLSATMNVAANIGVAVATGGATGAASLASSAANLIASAKPNIEHTGSISSTTGYLSNKLPYLVYEIPRQSLPYKYQDYVGYPSNITSKLSDLSGYTEIESIHLENIPATMNELTEIESLLKQGVIL